MGRRPGDLYEAYGRWTVRSRWVALLLLLLGSLGAGGILIVRSEEGLPVDFTPQALFIDHGEQVDQLRAAEATFGRSDNDLLLLLSGPIGTKEGLALIRSLSDTMAADARVERVDSLTNATLIEGENGDLRAISPADELPPAEAVARAAADPVLGGLLIGRQGDAAAIRVRLDRGLARVADLGPAVRALEATARAQPLPPGFELLITGVPFVRTEVVDLMIREQTHFFPIVAALFLLSIWALFRRLEVGLAPLISVGIAVLWSLAAILSTGAVFNILSVLVPTLVLIVGIADGVHLVARYREELLLDGAPEAAMGRTMRHMTVACFLTTFTTGAGFASLAVAETRVIRDFGVHCAVAMAVTWVVMMLAIPTWLAFLRTDRVLAAQPVGGPAWTNRGLDWICTTVIAHPKRVLGISLLCTLVAAGAGAGVRTNSRLLEMYSPSHPTWQAVHFSQDHLSGIVPIFLHVSGPAGTLDDPEVLAKMNILQAELEAEPMVHWATSQADLLEHLHHLLTGEVGLPPTREAIVQELFLAELADAHGLEGLVSEDHAEGRVLALIDDRGGREVTRVWRTVEAHAQELFAGTGLTVHLTGDGVIAAVGVERLIGDLLSSLGLIFLIILATLWALIRDFRLALLSAIPNMVPLVFTLGALAIIGADLQTTNIVPFTVAVGLAVDDTIHFITRYKEERGLRHSFEAAIAQTYRGAGRAIVMTSVLLVVGFSVLIRSEITSTWHFGLLSSVTMVAALLGDLFLLPALLALFHRD